MKKLLPFLAVAFSGFIVYLFDKIWGNSINWDKVKSVKIGELLTRQISLFALLTFFVITLVIYFLGRKILKKGDNYYSKKQLKLRDYNKQDIPNLGVLLRWGVYFDCDIPFVADLTPFCTKHTGPPIRFINNRCPFPGCENSRDQFNETGMKNFIESELIDRWEKIK